MKWLVLFVFVKIVYAIDLYHLMHIAHPHFSPHCNFQSSTVDHYGVYLYSLLIQSSSHPVSHNTNLYKKVRAANNIKVTCAQESTGPFDWAVPLLSPFSPLTVELHVDQPAPPLFVLPECACWEFKNSPRIQEPRSLDLRRLK